MTDAELLAYQGALLRLALVTTALQDLMIKGPAPFLGDRVCGWNRAQHEALDHARGKATIALTLAQGGEAEIPEALMRDWREPWMKRDAARILAATRA
jgi:hypothetical protein